MVQAMKKLSILVFLFILPTCAGIARQPEQSEVKGSPPGYIDGEAADDKAVCPACLSYIKELRARIGKNWTPPRGSSGEKARVVFTVDRSGQLIDVKLVDGYTSGSVEFQKSAISAITLSSPFHPLPEEFSANSENFTLDLMAEQEMCY